VINGLAFGRIRFISVWVPVRSARKYNGISCGNVDLAMHQVKLPEPTQGSFK